MKLTVTPEFPGSSRYDGTFENPCEAGALRLRCRTHGASGPVKLQYGIEWLHATHCRAEDSKGREVVLNKFHNYGWEGPNPFFGLPPTHNGKDDPAAVRITVRARDMEDPAQDQFWTQDVHYFTKLCQCRKMDDYGEEWLDWEMWQNRGRTLGKFYTRIRCLADNQTVGIDKVYYKIMVEKWPDVFKKDMWGGGIFTGDRSQLMAGVEEAERILEVQLAKPEPVKNEDFDRSPTTELLENKMKESGIEEHLQKADEERFATELLRDQVQEIATALAQVQKALAALTRN